MTNPFNARIARIAVGTYDGAQDVRIETMNRIRDLVRKKNEGIPFDEREEEKDDEERDYESKYDDGNLGEIIGEMVERGRLEADERKYIEQMLSIAEDARDVEERAKSLLDLTKREPIYREWLTNVYGISTTLTARLIHNFGYCEDFERVSGVWSYAGMAPGQKREAGKQLDFNPEAKTLTWLVATNMVRQGSNSRYRTEFYDPYKEKQERRTENSVCQNCGERSIDHAYDEDAEGHVCEDGTVVTLGDFDIRGYGGDGTPCWSQQHIDNRARRFLGKKFLKHYWYIARSIRGLETPKEYVFEHEEGHTRRTDTFEHPEHAKRVLSGD